MNIRIEGAPATLYQCEHDAIFNSINGATVKDYWEEKTLDPEEFIPDHAITAILYKQGTVIRVAK